MRSSLTVRDVEPVGGALGHLDGGQLLRRGDARRLEVGNCIAETDTLKPLEDDGARCRHGGLHAVTLDEEEEER